MKEFVFILGHMSLCFSKGSKGLQGVQKGCRSQLALKKKIIHKVDEQEGAKL